MKSSLKKMGAIVLGGLLAASLVSGPAAASVAATSRTNGNMCDFFWWACYGSGR